MTSHDLRYELEDGVDGAVQLEQVVPRLGALVVQVTPADLTLRTPCTRWSTHDLLNHVIGGADMFAGALTGGPAWDISGRLPDATGDNPAAAFEAAATRFGESAAQPGAMERVLALPVGAMTGRTFLRFVAFDLLVHTWDLATTLDQPVDVPEDLVAEADRFARHVLGNWTRDGVNFTDEVSAPDGAGPLERLIAYTGREP